MPIPFTTDQFVIAVPIVRTNGRHHGPDLAGVYVVHRKHELPSLCWEKVLNRHSVTLIWRLTLSYSEGIYDAVLICAHPQFTCRWTGSVADQTNPFEVNRAEPLGFVDRDYLPQAIRLVPLLFQGDTFGFDLS